MLNLIEFMMITEIARIKQDNLLHRNDRITGYIKPVSIKLSMMDRLTNTVGEVLISYGNKLKQHSHARLTGDPAQAPNIMIML